MAFSTVEHTGKHYVSICQERDITLLDISTGQLSQTSIKRQNLQNKVPCEAFYAAKQQIN